MGVEFFSSNRDTARLVILDIIMTVMTGIETYEEIWKINQSVKIAFASGYRPDQFDKRSHSMNGVELILKPVQPMGLLRRIRAILDTL